MKNHPETKQTTTMCTVKAVLAPVFFMRYSDSTVHVGMYFFTYHLSSVIMIIELQFSFNNVDARSTLCAIINCFDSCRLLVSSVCHVPPTSVGGLITQQIPDTKSGRRKKKIAEVNCATLHHHVGA